MMPQAGQRRSTSCAEAPKQALRPERNDEDHWQEQDDVGKLREQCGAECIDETDNEAADEGTEQASDASQYDDDQCQREHIGIQSGISGQKGSAQHPAGPGTAG